MILLRIAGAAVAISLAAGLSVHAAEPGFAPVAITVRPIATFGVGSAATRFGALEYRGGLQLSSANQDFGGWSGLDFADDGQTLYAIADTGSWLRTTLVESGGRLVGIDRPMIAPLLDPNGRPYASKVASDAEGLRILRENGKETALVSFEQKAAIGLYVAAPDLASARRKNLPLPKFVNGLPPNQGLEAIAVAPAGGPLAGAVVVIAEHSLDRSGNHRGFIVSGPHPGTFSLVRIGAFDVTDAVFLPGGDLLVLERRFDLTSGPGMRIRRIAGSTIRPGATVDGPVLIEADLANQIDNMEGLAVRVTGSGETSLTVISDDNHSMLQRTILLEFALIQAAPPPPRPRPG
jgi:hypothetical protein